MLDVINLFLSCFSGVVSGFTSLVLGDYSIGSLLFGGFVVGVVVTWILAVIRR